MIIFSFYTCISLYYVQGIKQYHKLCFSLADTTAETVKISNLHTGMQRLPFYTKVNYPSSPVRKVLTVSPKNCP